MNKKFGKSKFQSSFKKNISYDNELEMNEDAYDEDSYNEDTDEEVPAFQVKKKSEPSSLKESLDKMDESVRPRRLSEFIGQSELRKNLQVYLDATKKRGKAMDHLLFYGNPGLGKTTLAHIIASELGVNIVSTSGPALMRGGDLASILSNLQANDVFFIDEIHRMPMQVEEVLYPAMEDFKLDLVIGQGPAAKTIKIDVEPFTLVGATASRPFWDYQPSGILHPAGACRGCSARRKNFRRENQP